MKKVILIQTWAQKITCRCFYWMLQLSLFSWQVVKLFFKFKLVADNLPLHLWYVVPYAVQHTKKVVLICYAVMSRSFSSTWLSIAQQGLENCSSNQALLHAEAPTFEAVGNKNLMPRKNWKLKGGRRRGLPKTGHLCCRSPSIVYSSQQSMNTAILPKT